MQTVESLKLIPVWVDPAHMVASARILLQGHGLRVLGVVEAGQLVGTVSIERVVGDGNFLPVRSVMEPLRLVIQATDPIREVAQRFVESESDFAPVEKDGKFLGIVTANMLLRELGRSWDPLTGLSWSDRLREWGVEHLKRGNEVTIIFLDLDNFGSYNKQYGHIVGDRVLRRMARFLQDETDPERETLVRYGGDEFAIATIRSREEAEDLATALVQRGANLEIPDAGRVTFCVGLFGGKRTRERENIHFAATLDNLINLASKDCLSKKQRTTMEEAPAEEPAPDATGPSQDIDIRVVNVFADEASATALTQVILRIDDQVISGVSARMGRPVIQSVASATAKALERAFPGASFRLGEINLTESKDGQRIVSLTGQLTQGEHSSLTGGVGVVEADVYASVAEATIQAFLSANPSRSANPS